MALIFLCLGWMVGISLGLAYGAGADVHSFLQESWPCFAFLCCVSLFAALLAWDDGRLRLLALALALAVLGIWRAFATIPDDAALPSPEGVLAMHGTISDRPEPRDSQLLLVLDVDQVQKSDGWHRVRNLVLVRTDRYEDWSYGDTLTAMGTPRVISGASYWAESLSRRGIHWTLDYGRLERETSSSGPNPILLLNQVRDRLDHLCSILLPEPHASLLSGILVGGRTGMPRAFKDALNSTSTSHLVAVSGFNVAVVAGAALLLATRFLSRKRATLLALAAVWGYTIITGMPPSALRAAIMATMSLASVLVGRDSDALSFLALSGAVMAGFDPFVLNDIGFQLSFLATAGLILLEPVLRGWISRIPGPVGKTPSWLLSSFTVTLSAQLATLPVLVSSFHMVSLISPLTNLLVAPALSGLMATGAIAVFLGAMMEPLGRIAAPLAWAFLTYMVEVVERTAQAPSASTSVGSLDTLQIALYYGVLLGISLWPLPELTTMRATILAFLSSSPRWLLFGGTLAAASLLVLIGSARPDGRLHVFFLDVGEGDATLVRTAEGHTILVDGGPSPTSLESALGRRLSFLDRNVDAIVLTGYQQDRLTGMLEVARRHQIDLVLQPERAEGSRAAVAWAEVVAERQLPVIRAEAGQRIDLGSEAYLEVIWASGREARDPGIAVRLVDGDVSMLLLGDVPASAQRQLSARADIIRVPGQGAAGALDDRFVKTVSPRVAVFSVGADNRFGHPSETTVQQLKGTQVVRTDRDGTIEVVTNGKGYEVYTER